jgi:hypothetical protein
VLGPEHPDTLASMNNLANVYRLQSGCTEILAKTDIAATGLRPLIDFRTSQRDQHI